MNAERDLLKRILSSSDMYVDWGGPDPEGRTLRRLYPWVTIDGTLEVKAEDLALLEQIDSER